MRDETALIHLVGHDPDTESALTALLDDVHLPWLAHRDAEAFLRGYEPDAAGCALINPCLPGLGGLELQERLHYLDQGPPTVFFGGPARVSAAVRAMRAGAVDFLCPPVEDECLLDAVRRALARDRDERRRRAQRQRARRCLATLTPRERQTLEAVVAGYSNKGIARALSISPKTVELHRSRMMHKLGESSVAGAVCLYLSVAGRDPLK